MDTTLGHANAFQRILRQSLLATRSAPVAAGDETARVAPSTDAGETMPMLYRSEAFAEDLLDPAPFAR